MATYQYTFSKAIPILNETEIVVAGGGPAGLAAAICAARRGHSVALLEREYCLGGTATGGLVGPFMTCSDPDGKEQLIKGFYQELIERLVANGGALAPMGLTACDGYSSWHPFGHKCVAPFDPEILKIVAEEMCEEVGVQLLYGVQVIDAVVKEHHLEGVIVAAKEGLALVKGKMFIDCTGDGDMANVSGCPMQVGDSETGEMQAAGMFFSVRGLDEKALNLRADTNGWQSMRFEDEIARAVEAGEYPIPRRRLGMYKSCNGTWRCNITRIPDVDCTKSEELTKVAVTGRKQIDAIMKFLHKYVKGAEHAELVETAAMPGVRETRRIKGAFIMDASAIQNGEVFEDRILLLANSCDVHTGLTGNYIPQKRSYTLPYRILIPQGVDNLLAAGRNISCDRMVLSAIRVMPPCFGMGQAAGNAAALALESNCGVAAISVSELQRRLREENVRI